MQVISRTLGWRRFAGGVCTVAAALAAIAPLQSQNISENDVARRQFENGRGHMRRGSYDEGLKDFTAVAESYKDSTLADNALLEIARYYSDVADQPEQAVKYADEIIRLYPTSDSAPYALIVKGEVVLTRSRRRADLDAAVASFDRVSGIYPDAEAAPRAQYLAAEALRLAHDPLAALQRYRHIVATFPTDPILPKVHVGAGSALAETGSPFEAMEELQLARADGEAAEDADAALARLTTLYRLYVKPAVQAPFAVVPGDPISKAKLGDITALLAGPGGARFYATKTAVVAATESGRPLLPPGVVKPSALAVDRQGRVAAVDQGVLKRKDAPPMPLSQPQGTSQHLLEETVTAVNLRTGDWWVASDDDRGIQRFSATGRFVGPASTGRATRLAVDEFDRVAVLDREAKTVRLLDETGRVLVTIPARGTGYELKNPVDVAFDVLNYLYVLDRSAVYVFSVGKQPATLVRTYAEPENSPGAFQRPSAMAVDAFGRLLIADERAEKINVYN